MNKKLNIGGQAVIEGVMIRSPNYYTVAVRKNNKIITKKARVKQRKSKIFKWPIVRGFINMVEMLVIGMKTLMWSADQASDEDEKITKGQFTLTIAISMLIAIFFFVALPYLLTITIGFHEETKPILFNLVDGVIRIAFFLSYILAISYMKDVKTLFQYHGAEHMTIHCYEHNKKLSVENIKNYTTLHPRCGTAFLMIVLIVAILTFSVITPLFLKLFPTLLDMHTILRKIILFLIRLSILPLIAGISYELLKYSDKFKNNFFINILIKPGLWLQMITTKKPSKKQIEVARESVKLILKLEKTKNI